MRTRSIHLLMEVACVEVGSRRGSSSTKCRIEKTIKSKKGIFERTIRKQRKHRKMAPFTVIAIILLVLQSSISLLFNGFCLNAIRRSANMLKKQSSLLISHLLFLQVFQACCVIPLYVTSLTEHRKDSQIPDKELYMTSKRICNALRYSYTIAFYGTCLSMFFTTIDHFLSVICINIYKTRVTQARVRRLFVLIWIYLISVCIMPYINKTNEISEDDFVLECKTLDNHKVYCSYNPTHTWIKIMLVINILLPYIVVILMYTYILHKEYRDKKCRIADTAACLLHTATPNQVFMVMKKKNSIKDKRKVKLAIVICFVHAVLWAPSTIFHALNQLNPNCFPIYLRTSCAIIYIEFAVDFIAFLYSIAVPVIYCCYGKEFRKAVMKVWKRKTRDIEEENLVTSND